MSGPRVLIVDDERQMRRLLETTLEGHDYTVLSASGGREALNLAATARPEVVVLDLGLPDLDGLEVCRRIRAWSQVPIIVVSARDQEQAKVEALDIGADDYLTKPFGMNELLARIRVALRHARPKDTADPVVRFDDIEIDFNRRLVMRNGTEIHLTPIEYDLLRLLATNPERVLTQKYVLRSIWGPGYEAETATLRVHIGQLRRKIEPDPTQPSYIQTEVGIGYRFHVPAGPA